MLISEMEPWRFVPPRISLSHGHPHYIILPLWVARLYTPFSRPSFLLLSFFWCQGLERILKDTEALKMYGSVAVVLTSALRQS